MKLSLIGVATLVALVGCAANPAGEDDDAEQSDSNLTQEQRDQRNLTKIRDAVKDVEQEKVTFSSRVKAPSASPGSGARHEHAARHVRDTLCLTFSGLSKIQRVAGYRAGWVVASGDRELGSDFLEGLTLLANMRMCANVPAQYAIPAALSSASNWSGIAELCAPGGRLREQRDVAVQLLNDIPGVSCVAPGGAMYLFPRLDPDRYDIHDDQHFVIQLMRATHVMITNGRGFNLPTPDHVRFVTLPSVEVLTEAIGRIAGYLETARID